MVHSLNVGSLLPQPKQDLLASKKEEREILCGSENEESAPEVDQRKCTWCVEQARLTEYGQGATAQLKSLRLEKFFPCYWDKCSGMPPGFSSHL